MFFGQIRFEEGERCFRFMLVSVDWLDRAVMILRLAASPVLTRRRLLCLGRLSGRCAIGDFRCGGSGNLCGGFRFLARTLVVEPLDLLLRTVQTIRGYDFDANPELGLELRDVVSSAVLNCVGELGMKGNANSLECAACRARGDPPQEVQADQLRTGDTSASAARRTGAMRSEHERLTDLLSVDLE